MLDGILCVHHQLGERHATIPQGNDEADGRVCARPV